MNKRLLLIVIFTAFLNIACDDKEDVVETKYEEVNKIEVVEKTIEKTIEKTNKTKPIEEVFEDLEPDIYSIENKYKNTKPTVWGENIEGVLTNIDTDEKIVALTFDACGGDGGNEYDEELISYLSEQQIPATFFINSRWIDKNKDVFKELSKNNLFSIENHGYMHKPLSVEGKSVYNIKGTESIKEVIDEVYLNEKKIQNLTGRKPKYFRSGTAYYDDVSIKIVNDLGEKPVNFDIIGDAGATFSKEQVKEATLKAKNGSIIIYHMNQPKGETKEGLEMAIPLLKEKGFRFVKLEG